MTNTVLKRFDAQRHRGLTSFGYYLPEQDRMVHNIKETRIKTLLKRTRGENKEVLFHHRYSTSTADVRNACHPFSTKDAYDHEYIGVHNGVIQNSFSLKEEHKKNGIEYVSNQPPTSTNYVRFNDSEALIYDLAAYFEGKKDKITAYGNNAFIVMRLGQDGKPSQLFFGHNTGNPLVMKRNKNGIVISSEGDGEALPVNTLHTYDYATDTISVEPMEIPVSFSHYSPQSQTLTAAEKAKYDYDDKATFEQRSSRWYRLREWDKENGCWLPLDEKSKKKAKKADQADIKAAIQETLEIMDEEDNRDADNIPSGYRKDTFGMENEYKFRAFTYDGVKASFISSSSDLHTALLKARQELVAADDESAVIDALDLGKQPFGVLQDMFDFYDNLITYRQHLRDLTKELKETLQSDADKEDKGARTLGFQTPTSITPSKRLTA